jgi:hypothetical protein
MKVVEIARDENGNLKEIYRPDARTELRYPVGSGDGTYLNQDMCGVVLECSLIFENKERLDFYIK